MLNWVKQKQAELLSLLFGAFFVFILHFRLSYSLIPILCTLLGLGLLVQAYRQKQPLKPYFSEYKWLIIAFLVYFLLFVVSFILHQGKINELDLPSRMLLVLPILGVFFHFSFNSRWFIYTLLIAGFLAGIVALIQFFGLGKIPFSRLMHIQAGGFAMSLSLFSFALLFYFFAQKQKLFTLLSLFAAVLALIASLLTSARGSWLAFLPVLAVILWLNRKLLSKWLMGGLIIAVISGGYLAKPMLEKRYLQAKNDIELYQKNKANTSLGGRFDMWKSAIMGIEEKPLFGWGLQGVKTMREQHFKQKLISKFASGFDHAHNQYLQDASARGVLGLLALLGIFLVPLASFMRGIRQNAVGSLAHLWASMGVCHILATMIYCLTQGFLSHNSGIMFYAFTTIVFLGLQKNAQISPPARAN